MADNFDILDEDASSVVEPRNAPEGRYLATYVNYERSKNSKGNTIVEMNWRLDSPLENQDMTGVNLGRLLPQNIVVTENTRPYIKRDFHTGFNYEPAAKPSQWFEDNIGKQAVVIVSYDKWWKEKRGVEKPVVSGFFAA